MRLFAVQLFGGWRGVAAAIPLYIGAALVAAGHAFAQADPWAESYKLEAARKYAEAQAQVEKVVARQPSNDFAVMRVAWLSYLQGQHVESEKHYRRAIEINTKSIEARLGLMLPLIAQYRWADATKVGREVLAVSPWDYYAHTRLMICEEATSRWDDLAKHAAEVAARYPSDATALVYWARAESALGNPRQAKTIFTQVLERYPTHDEAMRYVRANP